MRRLKTAGTVLLTGGAGFVGLNLAEALLEKSYVVVILDQRNIPEILMERWNGQLLQREGNVLDKDLLETLFKDFCFDFVIHAAAITPGCEREKKDFSYILQVNILGTMNVIECAGNVRIKRLLYISSTAVYGDIVQKMKCIEEDDIKNPSSVYEISKYATERSVLRYGQINGMDLCAVRLGDVFGPWEADTGVRDTLSAPYKVLKAALEDKEIRIPREGYCGWMYAKDVAAYVIGLMEADTLRYNVYNCGMPFRWSIAQWCQRIQEDFREFQWQLDVENGDKTFYNAPRDSGMFSCKRIIEDTKYQPRYGLEEAAEDYIKWTKRWMYPDKR